MSARMVPFIVLIFLPLAAQEEAGKQPRPYIRVSGDASVAVKPDQVEINIGVVTQASSAEDAAAQSARQSSGVISSLRDLLGQSAEIKTLNYSMTPLQHFPKDGGTPTITGYTASNSVHVRTQNLAAAGKIIDSVTKSGANNIQGIQFTLHDDQPIRAQALAQAAKQARASGEALAAALGLHVVRILNASTEPASVRPLEMAPMAARAASIATPVESGTVDVRASVVLTLEVAP